MDEDARKWLEAFEKRLEERVEERIEAKFEQMQGWLAGRFDETDAKVTGLRTEMVHHFGLVRRDIRELDRRVSRLENAPMAAE